MSAEYVYIRFRRNLYDDVVRCSHGRLDPAALAESQVEKLVSTSLELGTLEWPEEHHEELAKKYAPHLLERWRKEDTEHVHRWSAEYKPLVWKEATIAPGSDVRMSYDGQHHYAIVKGGAIVDDGKEYSPSEWASKVAGGTSRNAWRDLWFKEPLSKTWIPAQMLRDQAREDQIRRAASPATAILDEVYSELIERSGPDGEIFEDLAEKIAKLRKLWVEGRSEASLEELLGELQ
jgi:hypothetical protein